jgi:hypothetical protein
MAITKITGGGITADSIDGTKIADDAINSEHLTDGGVDNVHIGDVAATKLTGTIASGRLSAANLGSGTVPTARLGSGTANSGVFLRGDNTWAAAGSTSASDLTSGTLPIARIANDAIDSIHYAAGSIDNEHLADDAVGIAELSATGTASSSTYLRGDNSWATVSTFDPDGAVVFNETGAAVDFRVESDDNANMLFVDGSEDKITIGTTNISSGAILSISSGFAKTDTNSRAVFSVQSNEASAQAQLKIMNIGGASAADRKWQFQTSEAGIANAGQLEFQVDGGSVQMGTTGGGHFFLNSSTTVFNEGSTDTDFRIESNNNANMFFVDGGNDHISIGTGNDYGGKLNVYTPDNSDNLVLISDDADANVGPNLVLYRNSGSPADGDVLGEITFDGKEDGGGVRTYGSLIATLQDSTGGTEDGKIELKTIVAGSSIRRLSIGSAGTPEVVINDDSIDSDFRVESNNLTHALFVQGSDGNIGIGLSTPESHASNGAFHLADDIELGFGNGGNNRPDFGIKGDSSGLSIYCGEGSDTVDLYLTTGGNLGIGTASPSNRLHVHTGDAIAAWFQSTHANTCQIQLSTATNNSYARITNVAAALKYESDITGDNADSGHQFLVDGAMKARIDGDGLKFNADTAAANGLDDYEEGTWTASISTTGTDYTTTGRGTNGSYTKVGRMVHANCNISINTPTGGSGDVTITGLPFANGAGWGVSSGAIGFGRVTLETTSAGYLGQVANGNTFMYIYYNLYAGINGMPHTAMHNATPYLAVSISYPVA